MQPNLIHNQVKGFPMTLTQWLRETVMSEIDLLNLINWRRQWHPSPVLLPGKSHGQRSLVGCGPWGHVESDTTERLHFHFSLSCIGEGNGNPLQCSCLENARDGGALWATIYGVAQSQTRLKRLSSSSSNLINNFYLADIYIYIYNLVPQIKGGSDLT